MLRTARYLRARPNKYLVFRRCLAGMGLHGAGGGGPPLPSTGPGALSVYPF